MVDTSRPFDPAHYIALWKLVPPVEVKVEDLIWTQAKLDARTLADIIAGLPKYNPDDPYSDIYPHVVRFLGDLYMTDGHHRVMVFIMRGQATIFARVLDLGDDA